MSIIQISSVEENGFNPIHNSNDLKSTNYLLDALFTKIMNENSRTSWDEIYGNDLMQDLFLGLRGNSNLGALATVPQGERITVRPVFFFVLFQKFNSSQRAQCQSTENEVSSLTVSKTDQLKISEYGHCLSVKQKIVCFLKGSKIKKDQIQYMML